MTPSWTSPAFAEQVEPGEAVRLGRVYYIGDTIFRLGPRITEGISKLPACWKKRAK